MQDQLESINTLGQSLFIPPISISPSSQKNTSRQSKNEIKNNMTPGLARLPIICAASMIKEFRIEACKALDSCLKVLDIKGIQIAVKGGALDVAVELIELGDKDIEIELISIWSSLVRYDITVLALTKEEEEVNSESLTEINNIKFFLNSLEENLIQDIEEDYTIKEDERIHLIVQNAAILSTISNFVKGRKSPRFVLKTLSMSGIMLRSNNELIKQWGALLIAEVLGSLDQPEDKSLLEGLKGNLVFMIKSNSVETRATAVYALQRWIPIRALPKTEESTNQQENIPEELRSTIELVRHLLECTESEGSPLVRKEVARMFIRVLKVANGYTSLALWIWILQQGVQTVPNMRLRVQEAITNVGRTLGIKQERLDMLKTLQKLIQAVKIFNDDPDDMVCRIVSKRINKMFRSLAISTLQADTAVSKEARDTEDQWNTVFKLSFQRRSDADKFDTEGEVAKIVWTERLLNLVLNAKNDVIQLIIGQKLKDKAHKAEQSKSEKFSKELFERTRLVLQSYLTAGRRTETAPQEAMTPRNGDSRERTWNLRHRVLEDSLVVAEQQVGLPWKWLMKDIISPDPWTTMTFHSFHSTVMSCNRTHDLLLWDWSTSRKTGHVHLDLPQNSAITSARFVNELHEQIVIVAEITNGDIHILAGPQDSAKIKPISNFRALDLTSTKIDGDAEHHRKLVTSWYRSSGLLCVGGYSDEIKIWDCPAEKCVQVLETESNSPITTLITEPVSGNLIFSGLSNGKIKLFDLRQSNKKSILSWKGNLPLNDSEININELNLNEIKNQKDIIKIGVVLSEINNLSSACSNGIINTYDLRNLKNPINSKLSKNSNRIGNGISSASFQSHSGLLSIISNFSSSNSKNNNNNNEINFSLYRTSLGSINLINSEIIQFENKKNKNPILNNKYFKPYTVFHPLRPFLSIGFKDKCNLIGSGIGKGDDTDSGSYTFLKSQN
ncbi:uncharacterized protein I206_103991 [Kwoniella pini CBS 10737]|uniref:Uncharacterized protein n=1 Tax=Kwoniella pini CBS 10737 TaxID=1296096 RepID=A0A1B9I318_9TREE|nr:uncharacterized protein I206_04435 [Kwoniella pini CBS 10737]OCF49904.1 hypothetical protein I206_04435 [Kwoniella pini CBS 10737]